MKEQIKIYLDSSNNYFLYSNKPIKCNKCKEDLNNIFFMVTNWNKKSSSLNIVCNHCLLKIEKTGIVYEAKYGLLTDSLKADFRPVFLTPPSIVDSKDKVSVFDAAELSSDKTEDKAFRSRTYPSLQDANIGKDLELLEEDKSLNLSEADNLLLELKDAEIITPKNRKLLEKKR